MTAWSDQKFTKDFDVESHEPQAISIVILNFYSIATPNFLQSILCMIITASCHNRFQTECISENADIFSFSSHLVFRTCNTSF